MYRKGGYPVAFGTECDKIQYVEDINIQPEHQLYANRKLIVLFLFFLQFCLVPEY